MVSALYNWFQCWDNNLSVDVISTDISKALDGISHSKLLTVLVSYGIQGNV